MKINHAHEESLNKISSNCCVCVEQLNKDGVQFLESICLSYIAANTISEKIPSLE